MSFLNFELLEESNFSSLEIYNGDLVTMLRAENLNLKDLEITIQDNDNIYSETYNKKFLKFAIEDKVMNIHQYDYLILKNKLFNKEGKVYTVILIKDLNIEKKFFFNMVYTFILGLIFCILTSIITFRLLLKKIKKQLLLLENLNANITLENLTLDKPINTFKEFENILSSYEKMLTRIDEQNKKQIEFVHNSSHELKTPIFIIKGYIDMIKRWGKNEPKILNEVLISVEDEMNQMNLLIEKLLFIAKENYIKNNETEIELSEIILECISNFKFQYPKLNITFIPEYTLIKSDHSLIKLLVKNLIENSIKYGENKKIYISIKNNYNTNQSLLTIKDHGIGMTKDELNNIHERFFRANKSRSKDIPGHGLGMSIVKKITNILNIELKIQSTLNVGTTINLFFNLKN
ncbi:MAG: sensor histidine kinase [Fusobacteriaceae bacterium]